VTLAAVLCAATPGFAQADADTFRVIDRSLASRVLRVMEITTDELVLSEPTGEMTSVPVDDCLALVRVTTDRAAVRGVGRLVSSSGQVLPGVPATRPAPPHAGSPDVLVWQHDWLGALDIPLEEIAALTFRPAEPLPEPGQTDAVVLRNGDRLEGFIASLHDPVSLELDMDGVRRTVDLPRERVASAALVTARRAPDRQRVWFRDGTVIDVAELAVGDDGFVRIRAALASTGSAPKQVPLRDVRAILFAPGAFIPLASLTPTHVESAAARYVVPPPEALVDGPALGLPSISYRGPILVRYLLPAGSRRFAADLDLPESARAWGDCEVIVRVDDVEAYRTHLNGATPATSLNVPLTGSELVIELTQGANGPIQDHVVLHRAMLLVE
jgi:hypothetical protein